jgi:hypothetical protein
LFYLVRKCRKQEWQACLAIFAALLAHFGQIDIDLSAPGQDFTIGVLQ